MYYGTHMEMTDIQIVEALIEHDEVVTRQFFFEDCRPLFVSIIHYVFSYDVNYNEFVNELYVHLMENEAFRLKQFQGRSSLYQWLKIVAIRFFISKRNSMIDDSSKNHLLECAHLDDKVDYESRVYSKMDIEYLFSRVSNKRYGYVLRRLILDDAEPLEVAKELSITIDNLYNLKKRAIASITQIALNETMKYEKKTVKK